MASPAAILSILVTASTSEANASLAKTQAQLNETKASAIGTGSAFDKAFGRATGTAVIAGFTAAVAVSVSKAIDFQQAMTRVETQAGATHGEVQNLSKGILDFAKNGSAFAPTDLANALFRIESGGIHGARALQTLKAGAELADVGGSDLEDTMSALVSVMNTGVKGSQNLGSAVGSLNAIVGQGNMRMSDLVAAMGTGFFSTAKQMGVSMNQAGAALATLTAQGQPAAQSATRMMMAWRMMIAPTDNAKSSLDSIGVSYKELGNLMEAGKMPQALGLLAKHLNALGDDPNGKRKAAAVIKDLFGSRGSSGITAILQGLTDYNNRLDGVTKGQQNFGNAVKAQQATLSDQWDQLKAKVSAYEVELGQKVIPGLTFIAQQTNKMLGGSGAAGVLGKVLGAGEVDVALKPFKDFFSFAPSAVHLVSSLIKGDFSGALRAAGDLVKQALIAPFRVLQDTIGQLPFVSAIEGKARQAFSKVPGIASDAWNRVRNIVGQAISFLLKVPGAAVGLASSLWGKVKGIISAVINFVLHLPSGIVAEAQHVWDQIKSIFSEVIHIHIDVPGGGGISASDIGKQALHAIGGLASGTSNFGGGMALVGERGPELAVMPKGTQVYPAHETRTILSKIPAFADGTPGRDTLQQMIDFGKTHAKGPYVFGGGHNGSFSGPYDCSGFVSAILHAGDLIQRATDTIGLKSWGKSGDSGNVVVGVRGGAGMSGHTMMKVGDTYFESGGGHGASVVSGWDGSFPTKRYANVADAAQTVAQKPQSPLQVFGKSYSKNELATLAAFVGMSNPGLMAAIAMAESRGDPNASNSNSNGTIDRGLWEINSIWGGLSTFDPLGNAQAAKTILQKQGLGAWSTYNNGAYKKFMGGHVIAGKLKRLKGTVGRAKAVKGVADSPEVTKLIADAKMYQEFADHAGDLKDSYAGLSEAGWLQKALDTLFALRNAVIGVHQELIKKQAEVAAQLEKAKKQLAEAQNKSQREAIKKHIQALTDRQDALGSKDSDMLSTLEDVQGAGGPMDVLASLPAIGTSKIGGSIFDVQLKLKDLEAPTTTATESQSQTAELLKTLLAESQQRGAVSEAQFAVLRNTPYMGAFAKGGVALVGENGPELAHMPSGTRVHTAADTSSMLAPTVIINGDITNTPPGKDPVEMVLGDKRFPAAVRNVRSRGGNRPISRAS